LAFDDPWPWLICAYKLDLSSEAIAQDGKICRPGARGFMEARLWSRNRAGAWRRAHTKGEPLRPYLARIVAIDARFRLIAPRLISRLSGLPAIAARPTPRTLELILHSELNISKATDEIAFLRRTLLCRYVSEAEAAVAKLVMVSSTPHMELHTQAERFGPTGRPFLAGLGTDEEVQIALVAALNYYAQESEAQELFSFAA